MKGETARYAALISVFFVYSLTSIFTKGASLQPFLSLNYILLMCGAVCVLGTYAVLWQQVLKRFTVTDAYMFKGVTIIFIMVLSWLIYGERITLMNCIGGAVVIAGIALYAKSE